MESGIIGRHLARRQANWRKKVASSEQPPVGLFDFSNCPVLTTIQYSSHFRGLQRPWTRVCGTRSGNSTSRNIHRKDGQYGMDNWREIRCPQSAGHACSLYCKVPRILVAHGYIIPRPAVRPYFG